MRNDSKQSVLQGWVCELPLMQQTVLIEMTRGPDGLPKYHISKLLLRWLRRCILLPCAHKQWVGKPVGCVASHWQCIECGTLVTAGDMLIIAKLALLEARLARIERENNNRLGVVTP